MGIKPTRKQYSKEFKLDVIQQSYLRDNIRELASELGLRPALIYKWRAAYEQRSGSDTPVFTGQGIAAMSPEQQEIAQLKRQLADAKMERDILKKAIGIFGKSDG
ncbi:transposase [Gracilimonas mengyeensis]|uniref:Transposase n=1 Tax=Gracilimonas mengyeensis TaxID=1302730 RepID=A0A521BS09_9BACT|nr:transposase [Gracilimonas mengyeensis]SMO49947.1 transposase [Gracilimonas mengyeensis]